VSWGRRFVPLGHMQWTAACQWIIRAFRAPWSILMTASVVSKPWHMALAFAFACLPMDGSWRCTFWHKPGHPVVQARRWGAGRTHGAFPHGRVPFERCCFHRLLHRFAACYAYGNGRGFLHTHALSNAALGPLPPGGILCCKTLRVLVRVPCHVMRRMCRMPSPRNGGRPVPSASDSRASSA